MNAHEEKIADALSGLVGIQKHIVGLHSGESIAERLLKTGDTSKPIHERRKLQLKLTRMETKTAIIGTGAINGPLTPSFTPPIDPGVRRVLKVRDLLISFPTSQHAVEMPVKNSATNNAGSQSAENTAFGESAMGFATSFTPCETIGQSIPASKQILDDAGTLDAFIAGELLYGLAAEIEDQILNGDSTAGELTGLLDNATVWTNASPNLSNELDIVRHAALQVELAEFTPTAVILNPQDWYDIETKKVGTGDDAYVSGSPRLMDESRLWSIPVVTSNSMASGTFLVGDFNRAATLFEREAATVEVSLQDADNFAKNMVTTLATERLACVIRNSAALVKGSL